jgi:glycine/D-amino acid oxidase-like deaminating enzyme
VDVAIVGAGYTGLWTAYYLKALEPGIRVAVVEAEIAGFGASGRNGGWCVGTLAGMDAHLADRDGAIRLQRAMFETVDEVERVCKHEGIDCHWAKGGWLLIATAEAHLEPLRGELEHWRELGFGEADVRWLEPEECAARARTRRNLGGLFLPHCAALHPARLARGLADAVERLGVTIYERSPALALKPRRVVTPGGRLRAKTVVRATEAYTRTLPGNARALLPMHSMMIATEPLPESAWKEIGLANREVISDMRRIVTYGQRTADDRFAFGSRGAYFYGSRIRDRFEASEKVFQTVQRTAESFFPILREYRITHRWGGALGRSHPGPRLGARASAAGGPALPSLGARAAALARRLGRETIGGIARRRGVARRFDTPPAQRALRRLRAQIATNACRAIRSGCMLPT